MENCLRMDMEIYEKIEKLRQSVNRNSLRIENSLRMNMEILSEWKTLSEWTSQSPRKLKNSLRIENCLRMDMEISEKITDASEWKWKFSQTGQLSQNGHGNLREN